jgi:hypothetical protein
LIFDKAFTDIGVSDSEMGKCGVMFSCATFPAACLILMFGLLATASPPISASLERAMGRPRGHLTSLQLCSALRGGAAGELQRKPEPWKQGVIPAERMDELRRQKESEVRTGYPSVEIEDQEFISRRAAGYRALEYSKAMIAGDGGAARMEAVLAAMRAGNASLFDVRHEMNEICLEAQEGRIQPPGNCAFQLALQACELAAQQAAPRKRTAPRQPSTEPPDPPPRTTQYASRRPRN